VCCIVIFQRGHLFLKLTTGKYPHFIQFDLKSLLPVPPKALLTNPRNWKIIASTIIVHTSASEFTVIISRLTLHWTENRIVQQC
jgi:hypothetical protein